LNFTTAQLDILCISAEKRYHGKSDNSSFMCHLFSSTSEFLEARNLPKSKMNLTLVNFLLWRTLYQNWQTVPSRLQRCWSSEACHVTLLVQQVRTQ